MTEQSGPLASLTLNDQKLIMGALKSLKNGLEVDYSKLAEHLGWYIKDDPTKPNAKKANNAWLGTRKKLFPDGPPAAAGSASGAGNAKNPATPRKKLVAGQETPTAQKALAKNMPQKPNGKEEETTATSDKNVSDVSDDTAASQTAGDTNKSKTESEVSMNDSSVAEAAQSVSTTPVAETSIADEMSAGSMSPTPASKRGTKAAATPNGKTTAKAKKTVQDESVASVGVLDTPDTPDTPVTAVKTTPKKRKTKAQTEAERSKGTDDETAESDAEGQPSAKKHKSDGTATKNAADNNSAAEPDNDTKSVKSTPVKTPRKPSAAVLARKEVREREKAAKKAEKEQEKADKKAAKEKEKAEKQAASKGGKKVQERPKPNNPSKYDVTPPAENVANERNGDSKAQESGKKASNQAKSSPTMLADQEEINKKANDVFDGARIDQPANNAPSTENDRQKSLPTPEENEVTATAEKAIVTNGHQARVDPIPPLKATVDVAKTLEKVEKAGDMVVIAKEVSVAIDDKAPDDTVVVEPGA